MSPLFSFFLCSHYISFPLSSGTFSALISFFFPTLPFTPSLFFSPISLISHSYFIFISYSINYYFLLLLVLYRVWEVTTGEVLNTLIHHNEAVLHLRFANGLMVTCSKDRSIAVWDMASPTDISLRRVLVGHRAAVNVVDFDDKYIVSASGDRTIKVTRAAVYKLKPDTTLIKSLGRNVLSWLLKDYRQVLKKLPEFLKGHCTPKSKFMFILQLLGSFNTDFFITFGVSCFWRYVAIEISAICQI